MHQAESRYPSQTVCELQSGVSPGLKENGQPDNKKDLPVCEANQRAVEGYPLAQN
jgi:hypothetical protein